MEITRKRLSLVPEERNIQEKINARAIYSMEVSRISNENLIFLDETRFNRHTFRRYGYSLRNTKAYITANRGVNTSLICEIGVQGVIGYTLKTGAFNTSTFLEFIKKKLVPYFASNSNKVLIMDKCRRTVLGDTFKLREHWILEDDVSSLDAILIICRRS